MIPITTKKLVEEIKSKNYAALSSVLKEQTSINNPALKYAIRKQDPLAVELLLRNNKSGYIPSTCLKKATYKGNVKIVSLLYKAGCRFNTDSFKENYLVKAVRINNLELVKKLIYLEKDKYMHEHYMNEALQQSIINSQHCNNEKIINVLLSQPSIDYNYAFCNACRIGNLPLLKRLIDKAGKSFLYTKGRTPFQYACENGRLNIAKFLFEQYYFGSHWKDTNIDSLLDAIRYLKKCPETSRELTLLLLNTGAKHPDALAEATRLGDLKTMELLLDHEINTETQKKTKLNEALCVVDQAELASFLIERGADVHTEFDLPLRNACKTSNLPLLKVMIKAGANIHVFSDSVLRDAFKHNTTSVIEELINSGANVHIFHELPLRLACQNNNLHLVQRMLSLNSDVHAIADEALRISSAYGHTAIVKLLLAAGADVHARNDEAISVASLFQHDAVIACLIAAGADTGEMRERNLVSNQYDLFKLKNSVANLTAQKIKI